MREKQILQIQDFVHSDLKAQLAKKENSELLFLMKQREEQIDKDIFRKIKLEKYEKNQREIFRERKLLSEFEEEQRKLDEKEFEKQRKIQEKIIEEKMKIKEKIERQNEKRKIKEEQKIFSERILFDDKFKKEEQKKKYEEKVK